MSCRKVSCSCQLVLRLQCGMGRKIIVYFLHGQRSGNVLEKILREEIGYEVIRELCRGDFPLRLSMPVGIAVSAQSGVCV